MSDARDARLETKLLTYLRENCMVGFAERLQYRMGLRFFFSVFSL